MKKLILSLCMAAAAMPAGRFASADEPLGIPRYPKDALAGCRELTAAGAVPLPQAVGIVQACLDNVYGQRGYTVTARAGRFGVPACPPGSPGAARCRAILEVEGILITVQGRVLTGDPVLMDLNYSLRQRGGKLLGWNASVDDKTRLESGANPNPPIVVPSWLDRAGLAVDAGRTGMIGVDGGFQTTLSDKNGNQVQFVEPSPIFRGSRTTVAFIKADGEKLGPSPLQDGMLRPNPGAGQLADLVADVQIPATMDSNARQAVRQLFDSLKNLQGR